MGKSTAFSLPHLADSRKFSSSESHSDFSPIRKSKPETDSSPEKIIENDISANRIFLYMKGTPAAPMCGFSKRVVVVLNTLGVKYGARNVLEDDTIREGIKKFSNWPTIPQL